LSKQFHENKYDAESGILTIPPLRAEAFEANVGHYASVFNEGNAEYTIPVGAVTNTDRVRKLSTFFFWSSGSAAATRPEDKASYTNNWPHEPLVGNRPTGDNVVWTGVSIIMLLAGISAMAWWYASRKDEDETEGLPLDADPLARWEATPSQHATLKYFISRRTSASASASSNVRSISIRCACPARIRLIRKWFSWGVPS
jgi:nitric oxide reductase subunit B